MELMQDRTAAAFHVLSLGVPAEKVLAALGTLSPTDIEMLAHIIREHTRLDRMVSRIREELKA
jgi:hypothetical protein